MRIISVVLKRCKRQDGADRRQ